MNKHTPGPWKKTEGSYGNYIAVRADDGEGKTVARIPCGSDVDTATDDDDASLIAAAPELLAACKFLQEVYDNLTSAEDRQIPAPVWNVINGPIANAIEKAKKGY